MKVFVLTEEYNEYDQYGEYFRGVFANPTVEQPMKATGTTREHCTWLIETGGGRVGYEGTWYYLRKENIE